jgi:hypothetical protein
MKIIEDIKDAFGSSLDKETEEKLNKVSFKLFSLIEENKKLLKKNKELESVNQMLRAAKDLDANKQRNDFKDLFGNIFK